MFVASRHPIGTVGRPRHRVASAKHDDKVPSGVDPRWMRHPVAALHRGTEHFDGGNRSASKSKRRFRGKNDLPSTMVHYRRASRPACVCGLWSPFKNGGGSGGGGGVGDGVCNVGSW